jgi:DNA-binding transcriptional MerR regulator
MHLDKAPDAFRTISEVADDLDVPQHVLRFWETRFTQIKPMKRSGGRRYYRPDDVDLLRGIRRLLYGEGYTIRGVQRILKEHGIKLVQGLIDGSSPPAFAAPDEGAASRDPDIIAADEPDDDVEVMDDEEELEVIAAPITARREPAMAAPQPQVEMPVPSQAAHVGPRADAGTAPAANLEAQKRNVARLEAALGELVACRQLLERAMKDD